MVRAPAPQHKSGQHRMLVHSGQRARNVHVPVTLRTTSSSTAPVSHQPVLAHKIHPGPAPEHRRTTVSQAMPATRHRRDPWSMVLTAASAVALVSFVLVVVLVLMRLTGKIGADSDLWPAQDAPGTSSYSDTVSSRASAKATRDAQEIEIRTLRSETIRVSQELATANAYATLAFTTPSPGSTYLDRPPLALVLDVPIYKQQHSLGCESTAAAMAANYHHVPVREQDILDALPHNENPHLGFRGNVDGPYGGIEDYGVYAGPIRQVLSRLGLDVQHLQGGIEEIKTHLRHGKPVIAWVTYGLQVQTPQQVLMPDDQIVTLVPYEHTVLIVGYNRDGLWVNDPYAGTQDFYPEAGFVRSFAYLGNMALVVGPPAHP